MSGDKYDLASVMAHYGIPHKQASGWRKAQCPSMHHDDKDPSASINLTSGVWVCHGCGRQGDALDLIMERDNVDFQDAKRKAESITHQTGITLGRGKGQSDDFLSF